AQRPPNGLCAYAALGGGFVAAEIVVAPDVIFAPFDGVRGQTGFGFIEPLLVMLEDPMGACGFKDQRGWDYFARP
ncbi:MAG TPA: hypothetical protein VMF91_26810, partial [Bryobacteraceae bacterium]|nr:hypothetical protein [Bryobacteraceae bacterium]